MLLYNDNRMVYHSCQALSREIIEYFDYSIGRGVLISTDRDGLEEKDYHQSILLQTFRDDAKM